MRIFISYRRNDSAQTACLIYEYLRRAFGIDNVFRDVEKIGPGSDFRGAIREAVVNCDVLLVIIGPDWLKVEKETSYPYKKYRRIDLSTDYVRMEVQIGLESDRIQVIPVCIKGAKMPQAENLPKVLKQLAYKNAVFIKSLHKDTIRLIDSLAHIPTLEPQTINNSQSKKGRVLSGAWGRRNVSFTIDKYDGDVNKLMALVTKLTEIGVNDMHIRDLRLGSIIIILVMHSKAATHLVKVFRRTPEDFSKIGVVTVAIQSLLHNPLTLKGLLNLRGVDWRGEDISKIELNRVDLQKSNLSGINLESALLNGANLNMVNLRRATLRYTDMQKANLESANLSVADMKGSDLYKVNLDQADMRGAILEYAKLGYSSLKQANLSNASMKSAHLRKADLKAADLSEANLEDAFLFEADLTGAVLRKADLRNANLGSARIENADLRGANLYDADLRWTNLEKAIFDEETTLYNGEKYKAGIDWKKIREGMMKRMISKMEVRSQ